MAGSPALFIDGKFIGCPPATFGGVWCEHDFRKRIPSLTGKDFANANPSAAAGIGDDILALAVIELLRHLERLGRRPTDGSAIGASGQTGNGAPTKRLRYMRCLVESSCPVVFGPVEEISLRTPRRITRIASIPLQYRRTPAQSDLARGTVGFESRSVHKTAAGLNVAHGWETGRRIHREGHRRSIE